MTTVSSNKKKQINDYVKRSNDCNNSQNNDNKYIVKKGNRYNVEHDITKTFVLHDGTMNDNDKCNNHNDNNHNHTINRNSSKDDNDNNNDSNTSNKTNLQQLQQ